MKFIKTKEFEKHKFFDIIVVSMPTKNNVANLILATAIEGIRPKLVAKFLFKDLPITIVNNNQINSPSIDFYYKRIKNKKYLFVIGNYKPKENEFYKKLNNILKMGKEIIMLNEFEKKDGEMFYLRKETDKRSKIELKTLKSNFKRINNAVIKGMPSFIFESAKNKKRNITVLFFNTNSDQIDGSLNLLGDILGIEIENDEKIFEREIENIIRENKVNVKRIKYLNYIG